MKVIDPGHKYSLPHLDGDGEEIITYVKREGVKYPGNVGHHPGTNLQEEWRAQIHRLKYLDQQAPHWRNKRVINLLRECIENLEFRAAERHNRILFLSPARLIEDEPACSKCGHIGCENTCG